MLAVITQQNGTQIVLNSEYVISAAPNPAGGGLRVVYDQFNQNPVSGNKLVLSVGGTLQEFADAFAP